jgi:F0F1-type ATP synthase assembly protein I
MPGQHQSEKKTWMAAEKYIELGISLPAATVIGWLLGSSLDKWLGTHWLYLAGLLLGIAAGFVHLIRVALSSESTGEGQSK